MTARSPTPWHTGRLDGQSYVQDNEGEMIPVLYVYRGEGLERIPVMGDNCREDALFIVRCVNAHDDLLAACRTLGAIVENECKMVDGAMRAAVAARDAIRKAEA